MFFVICSRSIEKKFSLSISVMIDETKDQGFTRAELANELALHSTRLMVHSFETGFSWTNALNLATLMALTQNSMPRELLDGGTDAVEFVLNVSVEAQFKRQQLLTMLSCFGINERLAIIGTTFCGFKLIGGTLTPIALGVSYRLPRNTGMLLRLPLLTQTKLGPYFEAWCDHVNGMEDWEYLLRMTLLEPSLEFLCLDLGVELMVGVNYDQHAKEQREQDAIAKIRHRFRSLVAAGDNAATMKIEAAIQKLEKTPATTIPIING
jgi:hypothetical protein